MTTRNVKNLTSSQLTQLLTQKGIAVPFGTSHEDKVALCNANGISEVPVDQLVRSPVKKERTSAPDATETENIPENIPAASDNAPPITKPPSCSCCKCCCCLPARIALPLVAILVVFISLELNLHFLFWGRHPAEALLTSHTFDLLNGVLVAGLSSSLRNAGVPVGGNRTEQYGTTPSGRPLYLDVYAPTDPPLDVWFKSKKARKPRAAVLYFHGGAWNTMDRELCGAHLSWMAATTGIVGFSASYRRTNSYDGDGIAACIDDAWKAYDWLRSNAVRLRIDPTKIVVMGDSAGAHLALSLATGLRVPLQRTPPALALKDDRVLWKKSHYPAAVLAGFPPTTLSASGFLMQKKANTGFGPLVEFIPTPAQSQFATPNIFVPNGTGTTAEAAQAQLLKVFYGSLLIYGQRRMPYLGWPRLPALPVDDKASEAISPLSKAAKRGLPPMLIFSTADDGTVPLPQQERFVQLVRRNGGKVSHLIQPGDHGEGGLYTESGRMAALSFLHATKLWDGKMRDTAAAGLAALEAAKSTLIFQGTPTLKKVPSFRWWWHFSTWGTLRMWRA